jgi:hypothetical protein
MSKFEILNDDLKKTTGIVSSTVSAFLGGGIFAFLWWAGFEEMQTALTPFLRALFVGLAFGSFYEVISHILDMLKLGYVQTCHEYLQRRELIKSVNYIMKICDDLEKGGD